MEQTLVLSSQKAREINVANTPSNFTTVFDRPLILDKNKQYLIGLDKINSMTYSWYNINPDFGNTLIKYYNGKQNKDIIFEKGNYSYNDINNYIKEILILNDDMEPDETSPITIEFDLSSFKCLVSISNGFRLDLRNSHFGVLIGFEDKIISQTEYGSLTPNITNSIDTLYIHCDLINNSIVDGLYSDVIYVISTADLTRSYPFKDEPMRIGFCEVNKTMINSINIYITDSLGKIINLNGVDTSFRFTLKEYII